MNKIEIDGHEVSRTDIEAMRDTIITWRDNSFEQWPEAIPFTTAASWVVGLLYGVIKQYPD